MEGVGGHHEGVVERAEVCPIVHFFDEDVAWVGATWNAVEVHLIGVHAVSDCAVIESDVTHDLGGGALGPVDNALVAIVEMGRCGGVGEVHIIALVTEREHFLDGFIT